jgi:hypothetical protein
MYIYSKEDVNYYTSIIELMSNGHNLTTKLRFKTRYSFILPLSKVQI